MLFFSPAMPNAKGNLHQLLIDFKVSFDWDRYTATSHFGNQDMEADEGINMDFEVPGLDNTAT